MTTVQRYSLPPPTPPTVKHVLTRIPNPENGREEMHSWVVDRAHPLFPDTRVVRMFLDRETGDVEVYSLSSDGATAMRNVLLRAVVFMVTEWMPVDVFIAELEAAEADGDDGGDAEVEGEPAGEEPAEPPVAPTAS